MTGYRASRPAAVTGHRASRRVDVAGHRASRRVAATGRRVAARAAAPLAAAVTAAVLVVVGLSGPGARPADHVVGSWGTDGAAAGDAPNPRNPIPPDRDLPDRNLPDRDLPDPAPAANPFGTTAPVLRGAPTRLRVPAIGVDTRLERLQLGAGGTLTAPVDFDRAGWYAGGTAPGDVGPAVVAGHVDSRRGPAVFYRLRDLKVGDTVEVERGAATVRFTVTGATWYPKDAFDTREVYGPTPDRQLRLVTCGGVFDTSSRSYKDNLVVYAVRN